MESILEGVLKPYIEGSGTVGLTRANLKAVPGYEPTREANQ
jgi:hypothetical protein